MLNVARREEGVTSLVLRVSEQPSDKTNGSPAVGVYLDYTYHPRSLYLPSEQTQHLDITDVVTTGRGFWAIGGIVSTPHTDLNEIDNDLISLTQKWATKCRLKLEVVTE
jgi:hypothetical protein